MLAQVLNLHLGWLFTSVVGFFSIMVADIVWVLYIRWSSQGRPVKAGITSALLVFNGWIGLLVFLGNPWVAIPAEMAGAFVGTVIAIYVDRPEALQWLPWRKRGGPRHPCGDPHIRPLPLEDPEQSEDTG
jgi:hypothetical protein